MIRLKAGVISYTESDPLTGCVVIPELHYSYTKQLRRVVITKGSMRIAEITKVKGATLPDVSICNNGRPIFRDPQDRLRVMDDGSVKRFVINSRDVSISIYIVARWKPEFAGIELTGNCRVVCYADDESAVCPV
ncbi:MAG: hypothetical protein NZ888_04290 [Candidatus Nitrosocaldus sp.]|nr:hypothetical protein [Candidatus Nitrosocaldus sp.]MDW8000747.1 hypothetical protein [Candidatus Nitrosocaldus sp.]